ncbi:MAG TPA: hypothetical protein VKP66_05270 [Steroidobacteraceae bacterium]|nr:hypothetical protein [Steroidobacteraceae bacterium]
MKVAQYVAACFALAVCWAAAPASSPAASSDGYAGPEEIYAAVRDQPSTPITLGGGLIDVVFADGAPGLDRGPVLNWIRESARAVATYFGRFPVDHVGILVTAGAGSEIGSGATYGFKGPVIRVGVGRAAGATVFKNDWVLVHEMTHLALPTVPRRSQWLLEGNATYVEPIARAQAGQLDPKEVWRWSVEGMPKGQPAAGDRGLDDTPTWGRTYWGGAIFWLLADVRIRGTTHNRLGVNDALRAINRSSGGVAANWSVEKLLAVGDRATGTDELTRLYAEMKSTPVTTDLPSLFANLGVRAHGGQIEFDDKAPLADVRRRITAPPAQP